MIQIPKRYDSEFLDVEAAVLDLLRGPVGECSPEGSVVTALPADADKALQSGAFFVLATRVGGGVPPDQRARDTASVAVSVLSPRRSDSWSVAGMVRAVFDEHQPGQFGVAEVSEMTGPVQSPFASPDRRMVTLYFNVTVMKRRR